MTFVSHSAVEHSVHIVTVYVYMYVNSLIDIERPSDRKNKINRDTLNIHIDKYIVPQTD